MSSLWSELQWLIYVNFLASFMLKKCKGSISLISQWVHIKPGKNVEYCVLGWG